MDIFYYLKYKKIEIKVSAHDTFLGQPSLGMLKTKISESKTLHLQNLVFKYFITYNLLTFNIPDEGYFRKASCGVNKSTLLLATRAQITYLEILKTNTEVKTTEETRKLCLTSVRHKHVTELHSVDRLTSTLYSM